MRVVQLGPYPPPHGGVQSNIVAIRSYLRARGIHCAVINLTRHRAQELDDVYFPSSPLEVVKLLWKGRYDVIHLHIGGNLTVRLLLLGWICTLMPNARTVLTFHSGGYPSSPEGRNARPFTLRGFVARCFDAVIGVNAELAGFFRLLGVPEQRIHLIYPHSAPSAIAAELPPALQSFYSQHAPVLVTVGLLEPEYDLPLQIEALGLILKKHPQAGLVIIGSGSLDAELKARIASVPYSAAILLCGDLPHAETLRAIATAAALLRTTLYDGDSVAVREALHLGTPVIATDNAMRPPGARLVPVHDAAAVAALVDAVVAGESRPEPLLSDDRNLEAVLRVYGS